MSEIHIDHEAAKNVCHARLAQGMHPSSSDRNIARALIDLHAQLAVERARVQKLAELVEHAYDEGYKAHVRLKDSQWPDTYQCSDVKDQLAAILNAQETPHA